jgi:hypothetical protein
MLLAMIVAGAGCAARHPAAAIPPASDSKTDNEACLPDPKDRCTAFSEGCPELDADTDGCPVVHVELTSACQPREPTLRALAGVARDIHDKTRLTTLRIVAHLKGCGEFVRQALVREGVDARKLELVVVPQNASSPSDVGFEVAAWDGASCKQGGQSAADRPPTRR